MTIKLMIKTHNKTGYKYLCKTEKEDHVSYTGSGLTWLKHLEEHGNDISTELIFETENKEEFKTTALKYSILFNVVEDENWANQIHEQGDGGDTVSNRMWITDGDSEEYIFKNDTIPNGWRKGRSSKCIFKNADKQKEFNAKTDRKKAGLSTRKAWAEGRVKQRDYTNNIFKTNNPTKKQDWGERVRNNWSNRVEEQCTVCGLFFKNLKMHKRWEDGSRKSN